MTDSDALVCGVQVGPATIPVEEVTAQPGNVPRLPSLIPEVPMTDPDVKMSDDPAAVASPVPPVSAASVPPFRAGQRLSGPSGRPGNATFSVNGFQRRIRHYSDTM